MQQTLQITSVTSDDIKFLKSKLRKMYLACGILSLFSVVFPLIIIYLILTNDELTDKGFPLFMVVIIFGFWIYVTIRAIIYIIKKQQNLFLQQKVEGHIVVLEKEIVVVEESESDRKEYQIKIYSEIEEKQKNIWINKKYYNKIEVGNTLWIEYFLDSNYIKALVFKEDSIKTAIFSK